MRTPTPWGCFCPAQGKVGQRRRRPTPRGCFPSPRHRQRPEAAKRTGAYPGGVCPGTHLGEYTSGLLRLNATGRILCVQCPKDRYGKRRRGPDVKIPGPDRFITIRHSPAVGDVAHCHPTLASFCQGPIRRWSCTRWPRLATRPLGSWRPMWLELLDVVGLEG